MLLGVYQSAPVFGDAEGNIEGLAKVLKGSEAQLLVLPELFNTGYQFVSREEVATLAEEIPEGRTCRALMDLALTHKVVLVFGLAERDGRRFYNSAAVVGPGGYIGTYRKVHLFADEKDVFDPGDTGFKVFNLEKARIGVMICFDWLFPESARVLSLLGADILCHPANLVLPHCQKAMVTRSLENGVFSATANRIGTEKRGGRLPLVFTGHSQIVHSSGKILASLDGKETGVAVVDIVPDQARHKKITSKNDRLGDRRPEMYEILLNPNRTPA